MVVLTVIFHPIMAVHRTLLQRRGILHRDMSIYNILLRPVWRRMPERHVIAHPPPFIQDILMGPRYVAHSIDPCQTVNLSDCRDWGSRLPECLLIDLDNGAKLERKGEDNDVMAEELARRTVRNRSLRSGR